MSVLLDEIKTDICSLKIFQDNQHIDWGDFPCAIHYDKHSEDIEWVEILSKDIKAIKNDRITINKTVYDIEDNIDRMLKVKKNELESQFLTLMDMGITIEDGVKVPVKNPLKSEDEYFVSKWIGKWVRNICENYERIKNGETINILRKKCENVPAVIVGAGPSLDKNISQLKGINAIIICTDRAYKPLLAREVIPDVVISLDCHDDIVLGFLDKIDSSKHILVMNTSEDFQIARIWKGRILYYNMCHEGMQYCDDVLPFVFPKFPAIVNVGCVINTALILSEWIGCSTNILVGCDFSYPNEKVSCDAYDFINGEFRKIEVDEKERFEKRSGKVKVKDIYTYPPFVDYLDTMKKLNVKNKLNIINATEGGIIDCFLCMSLEKAKNTYCRKDISKVKENLIRRQ